MRKHSLLMLCVLAAGGGGCVVNTGHLARARVVRLYREQVDRHRQQAERYRIRLKQIRTRFESLRAKYARLRRGCSDRPESVRRGRRELIRARREAAARTRIWKTLTVRFRKPVRAHVLSIRVIHGRILLTLRSAVLFDPGKDVLKRKGRNLLAGLALELKQLTDRNVHVAGHTDDLRLRYSPFRTNWELSALRAVRVVRLLRRMGVKPYRLSAGGFAEYRPLTENASWQGRWLNGRIEISLLPGAWTNPLN